MLKAPENLLYEEVAAKLSNLIEKKVLRPGDKLPSLRRVTQDHKVSLSTAFQAYVLLEKRGFIESRPRSGFYVRIPENAFPPEHVVTTPAKKSCRVSIADLHQELIQTAQKKDAVPFGLATPDPELLPYSALNRMMKRVVAKHGVHTSNYDMPPGDEKLRKNISRLMLSAGVSLNPDEIMITNGTMEAVSLALRAITRPGDVVAIETPTYFGILEALQELDIRVLEIPTHPREGLDLARLSDAINLNKIKCCIAMTNFNNPLGSRMPDEKKRELVKIITKAEIPLIEDDIFGDLSFDGKRPIVAKSYDKKGFVLLCSSFSKTLAPGYRVGWISPGRWWKQVLRLKMTSTCASATLPSLTVAEFLSDGGYERHLKVLRRKLEEQVLKTVHGINAYFPKGTKVSRPEGGFLLWVELPEGTDSILLFEEALKRDVVIAPGPLFSPKRDYKNFIRINCGHLWSNSTERGLAILGELSRKIN